MKRLLIVGPKRLLSAAIDALQRIGAVHIDRVETAESTRVSAMSLGEEDRRTLQTLERGGTRVDGILTLLPSAPGATPVDPTPHAALTVEDLDAQLGAVEQRVRELTRTRLELEEEQQLLDTYEGAVRVLSPLLSALAASKTLQTIGFVVRAKAAASVVAALREELAKVTEGRVEVVSRPVDDKGTGVVVAFRNQDADAVRAVLTRAGVSELRLPSRFVQAHHADSVALMERRKADIPAELTRVEEELTAIAAAERPRLAAMRMALADRLAQMKVLPDLAESRYAFVIDGWAPARDVDRVRAALRRQFGDELLVQATPIDPHEDADRVPVLLDNPPLIRPIQRLLALFQPPRYDAWDPSPVMAVTFPLFVGLVIGDAGYGLLLFLLGWWLRGRARAGRALNINFLSLRFPAATLADISYLIRLAAFWIILFGVIYAEFFGNLPELLFGIHPIFDRVHNTDAYFTIIVAAGILMIFAGLAIHLVEAVRHRHPVGIFESLVIMLGTAGLLLFLGARGDRLPAALGPVGLYLFGGAIVVAAASLIVDRNAMQRVLWLLESTASFGHILSYARLMAFGLAAAALATAANQLGEQASGISIVLAIFVGALFQALFFIFTILGHVIQPARLHWVEFFTKFKFHEHTGQRYAPFQKAGSDV